jgi:hypothetical protein
MLKKGVLACLLDGKGKVINCVVRLLSSVDLGSYVGVGVYRERKEGEETSKYTAMMQHRACYDYDAVQGCLKYA